MLSNMNKREFIDYLKIAIKELEEEKKKKKEEYYSKRLNEINKGLEEFEIMISKETNIDNIRRYLINETQGDSLVEYTKIKRHGIALKRLSELGREARL